MGKKRELIAHYWSVFSYSLQLALKRELEYWSYSICWLIMIPIELFSGIYMLYAIMDRVGNINGWTFGQVAFLYGIGTFCHGFQDLLFIQTRFIERSVIRGDFDRYLLRPLNVFFQFCAGAVNLCGIYDLIPGMIIFFYGVKTTGFKWTLLNVLLLLLVICGGTLIQASIFTITGTIAFWTQKSSVFVGVNLQMFDKTTQWPLSIYPKWFVYIFSFIIPMGFVSFYPACGFLRISSGIEVPFPIDMAFWTPIVGLIWFRIARAFFDYGLKNKYESAGS